MTPPAIIDRGRGPEIAGTRITVYDILDYHSQDCSAQTIAVWLGISSEQVSAALDFIERHRDEVLADYQRILERSARGNPPELQAKLDAGHQRFMEMAIQRRTSRRNGDTHDGPTG